MKTLLALFEYLKDGDAISRSMPPLWSAEYQSGSIAAEEYIMDEYRKGSPVQCVVIKRPSDYTANNVVQGIIEHASRARVNWVIVLSERFHLTHYPIVEEVGNWGNVIICEFEVETWAKRLGVWDWETMEQFMITLEEARLVEKTATHC